MHRDCDQIKTKSLCNLEMTVIARCRTKEFHLVKLAPWCMSKKAEHISSRYGIIHHIQTGVTKNHNVIRIHFSNRGQQSLCFRNTIQYTIITAVKGIWCVPKYSNPQGYSYSDEVVRRFAALTPAAEDFRIFWDNAYSVHHLYEDKRDEILEILEECAKAGHPDMVFKFTSTSKISFPGSGVAAIATSDANMADIRKYMVVQTIGHDKLNQLRHVRFFRDRYGVEAQMRRHADILRPKFEMVEQTLEDELGGLEIGTWTKPLGGYFISFDALEGCAKAIVAKAKEAGVVMTGAGATFPYGKDPKDSNIRIAPSYPTVEELAVAAKLFALCVKLVSVEKILESK